MTDTYNRLTYISLKCLCQKEEYLWDTEQIKNAAGVLDTILQTRKKNVIVSRGFGLVKVTALPNIVLHCGGCLSGANFLLWQASKHISKNYKEKKQTLFCVKK